MSASIEAYIGFSKRDDEPVTSNELSVPGYPDNRVQPIRCQVHDARTTGTPSLAREGFTLMKHSSNYAAVRDREILRKGYNDEMSALLKTQMNASLVVPSRNGLLVRYGILLVGRNNHAGPTDIIDDKIPASFAHVDYLSEDALESAAMEARIEGIHNIAYKRLIIIQTWRAVSEPPQDVPLAICDCRTLRETDMSRRTGVLAPENCVGMPSPIFYIGGIHYNPDQRWHYYPHMKPDEVLVFTGYDTERPSSAKVAHAAFDNRTVHPAAKPRESIEARFYVYYQ
jgi:hypothetical protein